jgi:hypothetical protein
MKRKDLQTLVGAPSEAMTFAAMSNLLLALGEEPIFSTRSLALQSPDAPAYLQRS